ncbi:MAG: site-specific DNA-methyltransferase, partial [Bacteroidia bacterium]|nr:site-specific DNA-methyltransferase [Bacteroidia bacterium]
DTAIETAVEVINDIVATQTIQENGIKVYVFSPGQYPYTEEFEEVLSWITLSALPDALYKAYLNVLPGRTRQSAPVLEDEEEEDSTQPNSFE